MTAPSGGISLCTDAAKAFQTIPGTQSPVVAPISSGRGIGRASRIATRVALATSDQPAQGDHTRKTSGHIIVVECRLLQSEELSARMEEAELDAMRCDKSFPYYVFRVNATDIVDNRELLTDLLQRASGHEPPAPEPDAAPSAAAPAAGIGEIP